MREKIEAKLAAAREDIETLCRQSLSTAARSTFAPTSRSSRARFGGAPLVYLDSAATSQKPRGGDRGARRLLPQPQRQHPPRRLPARAGGRRGCSRAPARGSPRSSAPTRRRRSSPRTSPRRSTSSPTPGARDHVGPGDAVLITQMEHHSNLVPWQQLARERGAELRYLEVDEHGELSLEQLDAELARGDVAARRLRARLERARHDQPRRRDRRAGARRGRARRSSTARRRCRRCPWTSRRSAPTSTPGPATRRSARPASACCTAARELLEAMDPFLTGGDMIASVIPAATTWNELPWKFEAGTSPIAEAVGLGAAVDYLDAARDDARPRARARADRARCSSACAEVAGVRVVGPPAPGARGGVVSFTVDGHAPARRRRAARPRAACACGPATTARSR